MTSAVQSVTELRPQEERQLDSLRLYAAPLLPHLQKPDVTDVLANTDGVLWTKEKGVFRSWDSLPHNTASLLLRSIATIRQVPFSHDHPILETIFPLDGSRIEGLMPPVVEHPAFAIRLRPKRIHRLSEYQESGILTNKEDALNVSVHSDRFLQEAAGQDHLTILQLAVLYRRNVLVVGATNSGKTTLLNGLIQEIYEATPNDRLVIIEDTPELQSSVQNSVALLSTATISQAQCLEASLRLSPTRIIVGEIRRMESAAVLVSSWNTGHSGGLATIHANSAKEGLYRLEELIGTPTARGQVARAIELIVFIDEELRISARRKVRELVAVSGIDPATGEYRCVSL